MAATPYEELFTPAFVTNPYPTYAHLRAESPVHPVALPDGRRMWLVSRYDDVLAALKDQRFVKDWRTALTDTQRTLMPDIPPEVALLFRHMLAIDPPDHTRLRSLVHKAFTPRLIDRLRPRIQQIADTLLDAVQTDGHMDLIDAYAFPLPITVIAELLGVPLADQDRFRRWSNMVVSVDPSPDRFARIAPHMAEFGAYLAAQFAARHEHPTDDLITGLVQAEESGDKLSQQELFSMVFLLLIAGHETTVNLIGNGTLALLRHPDQLRMLRDTPDLIGTAIEELLRYDGPVETATLRWAREDLEFGGTQMRQGDQVLVALAAADRDGTRFPDVDRLDITRADNRHVAFGHGIHYCLGAPLARLEGAIAINTLLRRLPDLRLAVNPDELIWRPGQLIRGLQSLPVRF
jgi:cytochrome P450